jgi:para-nitrobenzyl esterase
MYHFKWATDHLKSIGLGCFHSLEIPFVFNNFDYAFVKEAIQGVDEKEIQNLSHHIQQAWISFAHTGSPNYKESHFWESYNTTSRLIITFDNEIFTRKHPKEKYVKVFEE